MCPPGLDIRRSWRRVLPAVIVFLLVPAGHRPAQAKLPRDVLEFASEMAKRGNWREARYRWEKALEEAPDNPFILNNLAVALEATGEYDAALANYERALELSGGNRKIAENIRRMRRFLEAAREGSVPTGPPPQAEKTPGKGRELRGPKPERVAVRLPVPPKVSLDEARTLLVASFLTEGGDLLDLNREMVRFLRSAFRRQTRLTVLDVTPPPAIPEQSLDDLAANAQFWKRLGREFEADVIVTGRIRFDRRDVSGFREVDVVSPVTGHKVRTSRFVEQEQFVYEVDVLFFDGKTGESLHRDRFQRSALFQGLGNDPYTAFYELTESIASDILGVVSPGFREDLRFIFYG